MPEVSRQRRWLFALPVDLMTAPEVIEEVMDRVREHGSHPLRLFTLNPEMVMHARKNPAYAACFQDEALVLMDGIGIAIAGWRRGWPDIHRLPGVDFLIKMMEAAAEQSVPIFFYGGLPGVAEQAARALVARYPSLRVAGTSHGYLSPDEEERLPEKIAATGAKIVLAGLGAPRQELWLAANLERTGAKIGMGVGGSMDVLSGRAPRAPRLLRRLGLEWAYRLWRDPWRWRRLLVLPGFLWLAVWPSRRERSVRL